VSLAEPGLAGVALIAGATLAGAWLAGHSSRVPALLAGTAVVLASVVLADLVPDIWRDLRGAGLGWWAAGAGGLAAGYAAAEALARRGCACQAASADTVTARGSEIGPRATATPRTSAASGAATAAALAAHRIVEGAAVMLAGSPAVVAALVMHATGEGFALGALLRPVRRSRALTLLVIACVSPLAGAVAFGQVGPPDQPSAVMTAVVAGVLARTAVAAWHRRRAPLARSASNELASGQATAETCCIAEEGMAARATRAVE
jgi:zinc transporter ZupT